MNCPESIISASLERFDPDLERLRHSTDAAIEKMRRSLKDQGQLAPVIAVEEPDRLLLVDGFKRYRAARKMGWTSLNTAVITADRKKARAMLYLLNRSGGFSMIQEALLVAELIDIEGLTRTETAILMDRHKSWVSRRMGMIRQLSPDMIEALLLGLLPPGAGPSLARVPLCNQPDFYAAVIRSRLSSTQIRQLADIFCKAPDPDMKQMILQSPRQSLAIADKGPVHSHRTLIAKMLVMADTLAADTLPDTAVHQLQQIKTCLTELSIIIKGGNDATQ